MAAYPSMQYLVYFYKAFLKLYKVICTSFFVNFEVPLFLTLKQLLKSAFQLALELKCVTLLGLKVAQTSYEFVFFL